MAAKAKAPSGKKSAKKKPPAKKAMTTKMRLWLKYFLDSSNPATFFNKTGASKAAGYQAKSYDAFSQIGQQNFKKLQGEIEKWTDNEGLGEYQLKAKIIEGLECNETVFTPMLHKKMKKISQIVKGVGFMTDFSLVSGSHQWCDQGSVRFCSIFFTLRESLRRPVFALSRDRSSPLRLHSCYHEG